MQRNLHKDAEPSLWPALTWKDAIGIAFGFLLVWGLFCLPGIFG